MGLSEPVRRALAERGYTHPTPVQAKAFGAGDGGQRPDRPSARPARARPPPSACRCSRRFPTGEKRRARARSSAPRASWRSRWPRRSRDLGKYKGMKVAAIYGGASMKQQEDALEEGTRHHRRHPGPRVRPHPPRQPQARSVRPRGARRSRRDAQPGLLRGGHAHPRPPPEEPAGAALLAPRSRTDIQNLIAATPRNAGDAAALGRRLHRRAHPPHPLRRVGRVPQAAQPHLHAGDGRAGQRDHLLQHPRRHLAGDRGAQPQRLRRRAAQRRPAAEGARAGDGAR